MLVFARFFLDNRRVKIRIQISKVIIAAGMLCSGLFPQQNVDPRTMIARGLEQGGDLKRAQAMYEELLRSQPNNYAVLEALNTNYIAQKKYGLSVSLLLPRVKQAPADANLTVLLGKTYFLEGKEADAFQLWDAFLNNNKQQNHLFRVFSAAAAELRMFRKAIEYLEAGKKNAADPLSLSYDIANLHCLLMDYQSAAREYYTILQKDPSQGPIVEGRMTGYFGKPEALSEFLTVFSGIKPKNEAVRKVLGRLYIEAGEFDAALREMIEFDGLVKREGNDLLTFGQQAQNAGAFPQAIQAYEFIIRSYPKSQTGKVAKLYIGKAREADADKRNLSALPQWKPLLLNKPRDISLYTPVLADYEELIRLYPHSEPAIEARYRTAVIFANAGIFDSAKIIFKSVLRDYSLSPFGPPSCEHLSGILLKSGNPDSAQIFLDRILENPYASPAQKSSAKFRLAKLLTYRDEFARARLLLGELKETAADDNSNDALQWSMLLNTSLNDSQLVSRFAKAILKTEMGDIFTANELLQSVINSKNQFFLKSLAELLRVEIAIAGNDYGGAIGMANTAISEKSNIFEDKLFYYLARIYRFGLKDVLKAISAYEEFLTNYPASLLTEKAREELKDIKSAI